MKYVTTNGTIYYQTEAGFHREEGPALISTRGLGWYLSNIDLTYLYEDLI